jgi:hypothetical protein
MQDRLLVASGQQRRAEFQLVDENSEELVRNVDRVQVLEPVDIDRLRLSNVRDETHRVVRVRSIQDFQQRTHLLWLRRALLLEEPALFQAFPVVTKELDCAQRAAVGVGYADQATPSAFSSTRL